MLIESYKNSAERLDRPSQYLYKKAMRKNDFGVINKAMVLKTVYVGNLLHFTTEEQIYELFLKCGPISKIVMGLDRLKLTPCGFCFVIYKDEIGLLNSMKYLNNIVIDGQNIFIDLDPGFQESRQYGRGVFGGQANHDSSIENQIKSLDNGYHWFRKSPKKGKYQHK